MKRLLGSLLFLAAPTALAAPPAEPPAEVRTDERPVLDVVFALDTTGSMGGLLEGAKQKVWSIASRMASGKPTRNSSRSATVKALFTPPGTGKSG